MKTKPRQCYVCGSEKHLKVTCPGRSNVSGKRGADYTLAVLDTALVAADSRDNRDYWILDSGSSRHLVNDERLLEDPRACANVCVGAGGEELLVEKQGSVLLQVDVRGQTKMVRLENVQFAPKLARNLISFGLLEAKGYALSYRDGRRILARRDGGSLTPSSAWRLGLESR